MRARRESHQQWISASVLVTSSPLLSWPSQSVDNSWMRHLNSRQFLMSAWFDPSGDWDWGCARVTSLSNILRDIEVYLPERNLTDRQNLDLQQYTEGCRNLLNELHSLLTKYHRLEESSDGFREKARKIWKRLDWEPKDVGELRSRITSTVSVLNTFLTRVNR